MKRRIIFIGLLLAMTLPHMAQESPRKVLDDISNKLLSYKSLQADFSFTLKNIEAEIEDTFKGSLVISGEKFRLDIMGVLAICDGEKMWNYTEELNEASIIDPDESEFFNPISIFTIYREGFNLKTLNKNGPNYSIELLPQEEADEYERIILNVDHGKKLIKGATYFGTDGNEYQISISNTLPDVPVDDRFFTFDTQKYPGVTVYDMRE